MSGWICSYRAIWNHPIFEGDAQRVGVWDWMLKKAAWKDRRFKNGGKVITLKRGQLCVSQRQIEDETGMGRQAVRGFLIELEGEKAITLTTTQGATQGRSVITICKYDNYQVRETDRNPTVNQSATHEQPAKEQRNTLTTILPSEDDEDSEPIIVSVVTTAMWSAGKQYLSSKKVKSPGSIIGLWKKDFTPVEILNAIEAAQQAGTEDPIPYITKTLNGGRHERTSKTQQSDPALRAIASAARAF